MLKRENYSSEHIDALRKQTGADPSILERTVFAFGLLEALCRVKMPFIFTDRILLRVGGDAVRAGSGDLADDDPGIDLPSFNRVIGFAEGQSEYVEACSQVRCRGRRVDPYPFTHGNHVWSLPRTLTLLIKVMGGAALGLYHRSGMTDHGFGRTGHRPQRGCIIR